MTIRRAEKDHGAGLIHQTIPTGEGTLPRPSWDLIAHLERQRDFSLRTFGPGTRAAGVVDHIRKELREIEAEPARLSEWVDVVLLALDGAWRAGHSPLAIAQGIAAKQAKNEQRAWPDWRSMPTDKAIEHDRRDCEQWPCAFGHHEHETRAEAVECARSRQIETSNK